MQNHSKTTTFIENYIVLTWKGIRITIYQDTKRHLIWEERRKHRLKLIVWLTDIPCVTYRHLRNLVQWPVFPLSQFEQIICFLLSVCFYAQIASLGEKNFMVCFFAAILIFLLPVDHAANKMSLNHAKEIWKYILTLILFQISDWGFSKSCKIPPFHQKD